MQNNNPTSIAEIKFLATSARNAYHGHQLAWSFMGQSPYQVRHFHHDYTPLPLHRGAMITIRASSALLPPNASPVKTHYQNGTQLKFSLGAAAMIIRHNKKEYPCLTHDELLNWIQSRSSSNGFAVCLHSIDIDTNACLIVKPRQQRFYLNRAHYSGVLTVTDQRLFAEAIVNGVGRHKGLGFGMLKIIHH